MIVSHFQGTQTDEQLTTCIEDFNAAYTGEEGCEIFVMHDGPLMRPVVLPESAHDIFFYASPERHDDWGHTLRDTGIWCANGEYVVHTNADNRFYPGSLNKVAAEIHRGHPEGKGRDAQGVVFCVMLCNDGDKILRGVSKDFDSDSAIGDVGQIDCMQLVLRTEFWRHHGGWEDKAYDSDGKTYRELGKTYRFRFIDEVLGEHH